MGDKGKSKGKFKRLESFTYQREQLIECRKKISMAVHPSLLSLSDRDKEDFRTKMGIELKIGKEPAERKATNLPTAIRNLKESGLCGDNLDDLIEVIGRGTRPTAIQMQVWPAAMQGWDLIGLAPCGTGKTLAYLMPMLEHMNAQSRNLREGRFGPMALILVTNIDLANQITKTFEKLPRASSKWKMAKLTQGVCLRGVRDPRLECDILVATPGRLVAFIGTDGAAREGFFARTTFVVVDEADDLLVGAESAQNSVMQVRDIMQNLRPDVQALFMTATWDESLPDSMQCIGAKPERRNPLIIEVDTTDLVASQNVEQSFLKRSNKSKNDTSRLQDQEDILATYWPKEFSKMDALHRLVVNILEDEAEGDDPGNGKILIFANDRETVDLITKCLNREGVPSQCLKGIQGENNKWERDAELDERRKIIASFGNREDPLNVLVATDVAGRGMDFKTCRYVILYEYPYVMGRFRNAKREYVHRVGRTGRAGRQGYAITLLEDRPPCFEFRHCREICELARLWDKRAGTSSIPPWIVAEERNAGRHHGNRKDYYYRRQQDEEARSQERARSPGRSPAPAPQEHQNQNRDPLATRDIRDVPTTSYTVTAPKPDNGRVPEVFSPTADIKPWDEGGYINHRTDFYWPHYDEALEDTRRFYDGLSFHGGLYRRGSLERDNLPLLFVDWRSQELARPQELAGS